MTQHRSFSSSWSDSPPAADPGFDDPQVMQPAKKIAREGGSVRYRARVEYDGTDFAGFQAQARGRTVQGELERVLARFSASGRQVVEGAGRTDAGVHARGQVIAFTYSGDMDARRLGGALNALLPRDVAVGPLQRVAPDFRPRQRARAREYRYSIWNGARSPLRERFALGVRRPLDTVAMSEAAAALRGRHDFTAFGGPHRQPVRTLYRVEVRRAGREITLVVVGDAFLRHMVRRLVAGLVRVGSGRANKEEISAALRSGQPAFAGETAPAHGLCLWRVSFQPVDTQKVILDER